MKIQILLLLALGIQLACNESKTGRKEASNDVQFSRADTIVDPVTPYIFEVTYNNKLKVSPEIFPTGSKGIGIWTIYVDNESKIQHFEAVSIKVKNKGSLIYDYPQEGGRIKQRLDSVFKSVVEKIEVKKILDTIIKDAVPYTISIRLE